MLATSDKRHVARINPPEIRSEVLLEHIGDCDLIGSKVIGPVKRKTKIRFKAMDDFESYLNANDVDYDSEDVIFTGYVYTLNTLEFNKTNRCQCGRGTDFTQDFVEYTGNNCYILTSGNCFIKCNKNFADKNYTERLRDFVESKK